MQKLEINLFGRTEIKIGGKEAEGFRTQTALVLGYLLTTKEYSCPRGEIADVLNSSDDPDYQRGRDDLSKVLYEFKKKFSNFDIPLKWPAGHKDGLVSLDTQNIDSDVLDFRQAMQENLIEALELLQKPFLPELDRSRKKAIEWRDRLVRDWQEQISKISDNAVSSYVEAQQRDYAFSIVEEWLKACPDDLTAIKWKDKLTKTEEGKTEVSIYPKPQSPLLKRPARPKMRFALWPHRRFSILLSILAFLALVVFSWVILDAKPLSSSEAKRMPTTLLTTDATPTPLATNVAIASSTIAGAETSTEDCFDRVTSFAANAENSTATLSPPYNDQLYTGPAMLVYTTSNSTIEIRGLSQLNRTNSIDVLDLEPIIGLYAIENPDARDTFRLLATTQKGIIYSWIVGIDDKGNISYSAERNLEGHTERVNSLVGIEDGARMISAADDGQVILWNFETGAPGSIWRLDKPDSATMTAIHSMAYHSDGIVAFGNGVDGINEFGYEAAMPIDFPAICYAADGHNLCTVRGLSVKNKAPIKPVHQSRISSVAFSKDGQFLFSVGVNDPEIKIWKLNKLDARNFEIDYVTAIPIPELSSSFEIFNVTVGGNDDFLLIGIHSLPSSQSADSLRTSYFSVFEFNSADPQERLYVGDLIGKTANSQILFTMLIPDTTNLVTASADELLSLYNYNIEDGERQEPVDYIDLKDELQNDNVTILYVSRTVIRDGIPDTDVSENSEVIAVLTSINTEKKLMIYGINDACLSH